MMYIELLFQGIADILGVPLVVVLLGFKAAGIAAMVWLYYDLVEKPRRQP